MQNLPQSKTLKKEIGFLEVPAENVIERSFSGGEIAPALYARVDHTKYTTGLRTCRNMICMRHGGATQRPGTMYVATTLNGGNAVRLIPFIFNETGLGQSYVLELGNLYVAFYQNGGVVTSGGIPYKITSPYLQADLATLKFAETADVITITHPNYLPMELKRIAPINWTLTAVGFGSGSPAPGLLTFSGGGSGSVNYTFYVTSIDANGNESDLSDLPGSGINPNTISSVAAASASNLITVSWAAVGTAIYYKIYVLDINGSGYPSNGYVATVYGHSYNYAGQTPDYNNQLPQRSPFSTMTAGQYPSTVGFVQQRRFFAASLNNPLGVWGSRPGNFSSFDYHPTASQDDDTLVFSIAGEEVNSVQFILELKFMLLLTSGAEIYVQGNGTGVVTPSNINASVQSQYGSSPLRPLKVGDVLLFTQALGGFIRDLAFDFVIDGYRGNDLTVFSAHLFEGHQILDWAYQKIPDSIVWVVRDDGVLLSLTYVREQQILAWARHDFINGFVEHVVSIPENGNYAVYVVVKRTINGVTVRYIERLGSRIWQGPASAVANGTANSIGDPIDSTYLDCYASYDGRNTTVATMLLTSSAGFQSGTGTEYRQQLILTSSIAYFGAGQTAQVGDEIFLQDGAFVSSQGTQGNQIRCLIQSVTSGTVCTVTPNRAVPAEFQGIPTSNWARAVKTVSGLGYLQGQQVSVWADRFVVGSPLNAQVTKGNPYVVSVGGSITLDKCYAVIYVGLPMTADFETLQIDTSFGDSMLGEQKDISRLIVYLYNTRGFFGGTENPDLDPDNIINGVVQDRLYNLMENKAQGNRLVYDAPPGVLTDSQFLNVPCSWSKEGRIFIRNVDPIPLSILAVVPSGLTSAKVAWSQKV